MPKFLTFVGRLSCIYSLTPSSAYALLILASPRYPLSLGIELQHIHTRLMVMISPFDFLTFLNFIKKYQNLDLATTVFGANILMR